MWTGTGLYSGVHTPMRPEPERSLTPFLDGFREQGTVFEHAYTQVPITLPSHTSLMTGLAPSRLGVMRNGDTVPESVVTLAEIFDEAGYHTGGFISLGVLSEIYGLNQGFDSFVDPFIGDSDRWYRSAEEVLEPATSWLRQNQETPFFLWLHLSDPHEPYLPVDAPPDTSLSLDGEVLSEWNLVSKTIHRTTLRLAPGDHRLLFNLLSRATSGRPARDSHPASAISFGRASGSGKASAPLGERTHTIASELRTRVTQSE